MGTLLRDIRHGMRMLARSPGFTAVAVLTLALGIGANTAVFSVVNGLFLRGLPVHDPGALVTLGLRTKIMRGSASSPTLISRISSGKLIDGLIFSPTGLGSTG